MTLVPEHSIFTKIINREVPADIVYEDDMVIAILTIEPINHGHTLVIPKVPFENIFDADETVLGHMMVVAKKISLALLSSELGSGVNIIMNNGGDSGQEVWHAHLHVIPRAKNDGVVPPTSRNLYRDNEAALVALTLKELLQ